MRSYDPATGKLLWELRLGGGRCSASPVGDEERLYVGLGGGRGGRGGRGGGQEARMRPAVAGVPAAGAARCSP